jgi:hypothetical protein
LVDFGPREFWVASLGAVLGAVLEGGEPRGRVRGNRPL